MADTQLPLLGVIICCTSIPPDERRDLAAIAQQMGAVHKLDLTSDVTHLVVGDSDTPKYKFVAKERPDVKCVQASWILAVRASWLEGGVTNVEALELEHKLPTFAGLKICVTGFEDLIYRKQLEDLITANGGEYQGNLTKTNTHLIAKVPSGAKYKYAGEWRIKVVAVEWLEQSLEREMILDESLYNLAIPPLERGKNAWVRRATSTISLGKRHREDEPGSHNTRKLRRTASARLSSQNIGLWTDIVGLDAKPEEKRAGQPENEGGGLQEIEYKDRSPGSRSRLNKKLGLGHRDVGPGANQGPATFNLTQMEGLFQNRIFFLHGFDEKKSSILKEHLRAHGADIIADFAQIPSLQQNVHSNSLFYLVPHDIHDYELPSIPPGLLEVTLVTELWVERCLYKKKFEEPHTSVINVPFWCFPIQGFGKLSVSSTSFQGIDIVHVSKAVKLMGATYEEFFKPSISVLICNAVVPGHEKLHHAQLWAIPAVHAAWLWDCIRKGQSLPFDSYLVQPIKGLDKPSRDAETVKVPDQPTRAPKSDRNPSTFESKTNKPAKRYLPPLEVYKKIAKDGSDQGGPFKLSEDDAFNTSSDPPAKRVPRSEEHTPLYLDHESPRPPVNDANNGSSNALNATSAPVPLREITPNSSPPNPFRSPAKSISPIKAKPLQRQPSEDSSLGPAISSLLAHHQRANSAPQLPNSSDSPRMGRRRRQLLGRAPSNLSSHSNHLSRASSVDTMNTDGLGTPLDLSNNMNNKPEKAAISRNLPKAELPLYFSASHEDDPDKVEEPLQMTQLGYEDPDVAAWRERVAIKMGGGKVKGTAPSRKATTSTVVKDEGACVGSLGIAKRTRLASGR